MRIGRFGSRSPEKDPWINSATETLDHLLSTVQWPEFDDCTAVLRNQNVVGGRQCWTDLRT
jgi:hypothetical protein